MPFDNAQPVGPAPNIENDKLLQLLIRGRELIAARYIKYEAANHQGGMCTAGVADHVVRGNAYDFGSPMTMTMMDYLGRHAVKPTGLYPDTMSSRNSEVILWDKQPIWRHAITHNNLNGYEATVKMWDDAIAERRNELMRELATQGETNAV